MLTDVHFPLLVRGRPPGSRNVQAMLVNYRHRATLAEIGRSELNTVATVSADMKPVRHNGVGEHTYNHYSPELRRGQSRLVFAEYGGRLFRNAGSLGMTQGTDGSSVGRLTRPFTLRDDINPVTAPVLRHYRTLHSLWTADEATFGRRLDETWPRSALDRNEIPYDAIGRGTGSLSGEDMESAIAMFERRCEGVLIVEGDLWVETGPPCTGVSYEVYDPDGIGVEIEPQVAFSTRYRRSHDDADVMAECFPLASPGPTEYADWLTSVFGGLLVDDRRTGIEHGDSELLAFDGEKDMADRVVRSIARHCRRSLSSRPELMAVQDASALAALADVWDGMLSSNPVMGHVPDLSGHLPQMFGLWESLGRRSPQRVFGFSSQKTVDLIVERALDSVDNRPIDITEPGRRP